MRIALISDIHANLPALEAVLAEIDSDRTIDAVYHLGDLVGYAPWPNEVIALLRARSIAGVAGNYDSTTATRYKHCGCKYEDPAQEELSHVSYAWTLEHTSDESSVGWARSVPAGLAGAGWAHVRARLIRGMEIGAHTATEPPSPESFAANGNPAGRNGQLVHSAHPNRAQGSGFPSECERLPPRRDPRRVSFVLGNQPPLFGEKMSRPKMGNRRIPNWRGKKSPFEIR